MESLNVWREVALNGIEKASKMDFNDKDLLTRN